MVERLRRHPLQADKLTLAALAGKLGLYLEPERVFEDDKTGPFRIAAFNMGILWATASCPQCWPKLGSRTFR
jgi:hypothetical protein